MTALVVVADTGDTDLPECDDCGACIPTTESVLCARCRDEDAAKAIRTFAARGRLLGTLARETIEALETIADDVEAGR